jgi:hypothetical protein
MSHKVLSIVIRPLGEHQTIAFAAQELARYLRLILGDERMVVVQPVARYAPGDGLWLGLGADLDLDEAVAVPDPALDDAIAIDIQSGQGTIAGANPRSVLLGVYRFLTEAGCRWLRPGAEGELIPRRKISALSARLQEKPSYRHRGICIEGAVSYENVAEIIDWAPKVGFNAYFTQFREAYTFFDRWYRHLNNPNLQPEPFGVDRARELLDRVVGEVTRRNLVYHAVGHGWTCEPLGLPGLSWDSQTYDLPPSVTDYLAEVNGVRAVWQGIPLNTNLCYSNPEVQRTIVRSIADYAQKHPDIDVLHFWLADGSNNQCECENCRKMIPSDFYVRMLNAVDELLTARGLKTRIVFLIYVDLLWPPQTERIAHPERFILMFAPITRTYSRDFAVQAADVQIPPYQRNKLRFPANVDENVAFLRAWQELFAGDSFDFDYHLMWDHFFDPSTMATAHLLNRDIKLLKAIGLDGFMSCQVQRSFFPTGLGMMVMCRTLWNERATFEEIASDYFQSAFGDDGALCQAYLEQLSALFDPPYLRGEKPQVSGESAECFARIPGVVRSFRPVIERNVAAAADACRATSWRYMQVHADLCIRMAGVLEARARGDKERSLALWQGVVELVQRSEMAVQPALDVYEFIQTVGRRVVNR